MDHLFRKAEDAFKDVKEALKGEHEPHEHENNSGGDGVEQQAMTNKYRFQSFAPESSGSVKWYVDGASYFHAVSMALEGTG